MATYEYAKIVLSSRVHLGEPMTVSRTVGIPADDGSVDGMKAVDALNRLGARGWRPLQVVVFAGELSTEGWHLVRSSDDKPGGGAPFAPH